MEELLTSAYQDIPRYDTAIAEWLCCMLFCFFYPRKMKNTVFAVAAVLALILQMVWLVMTGEVPTVLWIPCMLIAIGIMLLFLWMILDTSFRMVLYCCMKAFLMAEFMASLEWQLEYFAHRGREQQGVLSWITLGIVYSVVGLIFWIIEARMKRDEVELEISIRELGSTLLIVFSAFMLSNLSFVYRNTPFSGTIASDIFTIRTLVDFGGLAILYAYQSLRYEIGAEKELSRIQSMLTAQYDSYRNYQEITDLINMKYQNLKHQIAGFSAEQDPEKRSQWIDQMEGELSAYQPERQTETRYWMAYWMGKCRSFIIIRLSLPVLWTENFLISCMLQIFVPSLEMHWIMRLSMYLCSRIQEKRIIHMEISLRKQFLYAEIRNYCDGEVRIRNGFPVTTKQDAKNHGFGIKSISYAVKKYGGTIQFGVKDHFFSMRILIPKDRCHYSS